MASWMRGKLGSFAAENVLLSKSLCCMLIRAKADTLLAIDKHGEYVFANNGGPPKTAVRVPGGDHEYTPYVMGYEAYLATMLGFIMHEGFL